MLQILRDKAQSIVIQAIVVIIALVFIFWGVGTNMMNKQEAAIVVNNEEISFQQFQQAYDQAYSRLAQQFGGTVPKGLADSFNIKEQVISQLTQQALLRQGGLEMGLMVSGHEIQKEIEDMVQFQENGSFNLERYKSILATNRLSPQKFEESMRYDLLSQKAIASLSGFALEPTSSEIEELYNLEKETVSVAYAVISTSGYEEEVEVGDEDLETWFQTVGENYLTDPMVKITYLPFEFNALGDKITIEDSSVQSYYDERLTEYQIPEKRSARHILFKASPEDPQDIHDTQMKRAEEILAQAKSGADFSTLAKEHSEGPSAPNGGSLGSFGRGQMVQPFEEAVFSMEVGEVSDIVKTDFGYHIILLEEIQQAKIRSLDEVKEQIIGRLKLEQAKPLAFQMVNEAYEKIIAAGSLAAYLSNQPDTTVVETEFFSRNDAPAGMAREPQFLDRAFQLKEGELSSIIETSQGYAILSAVALKEPEVPELADIKAEVLADYRAERAGTAAKEAAQSILEKLQNTEEPFEQVLAAEGIEVSQSGPLTKSGANEKSNFPPSLIQAVFSLSATNPLPEEPQIVGTDYYLYQFNERKPPETELGDEDRDRYRQMLVSLKQQQIIDGWLKNQEEGADIFIHQSLNN